MADKKLYTVTVGSNADKPSAEQTGKDIAKNVKKGVLSVLKDGYIEVPAEIKAPIKGASKELKQAQSKVLTQWKKTFKEGFSSSKEDLDKLIKAYNKFKGLAKGKTQETQAKWITDVIGKQVASYKKDIAKLDKKIKTTKPKARNLGGHSKEEIDANIQAERKRRLKGIKRVLPKGYGSGWVDESRTNEVIGKKSEISFYGSKFARQMAQSRRKARKWERESLVEDKYETKEELNDELKRRHEQDKITAQHPIQGTNKNILSPQEKALGLSEAIRGNILPELLDKIKTSVDDAEVGKLTEKFLDAVETVAKLNEDAGKLIFSDVKKTIGITMGKLGFTTNGLIGGTEGGDKTEASRDPKIVVVLKELLNKIATKEDLISQELIKLEQLNQKPVTKSNTEKTINNFANRLITETHNASASQKANSQKVEQAINKNQASTEKQTAYDKIENTAERVADREAGKKSQELVKTSKEDLTSGFNTDSKADEAISVMKQLGEYLSPIAKTLESIANAIINPPEKKEGPTDKTELQPKQKRKIKQPSVKKENQNGENLPVPFVKDKWFYPNQFGKDIYGRKVVHGGQERKTTAQDRTAAIEDFRPTTKLGIKSDFQEQMRYRGANLRAITNQVNKDVEDAIKQHIGYLQNPPKLPRSEISTSLKDPSKLFTRLKDSIADLLGVTAKYKKVMSATSEEQDALAAKTVKTYGIRRGGNITGDKIAFARNKSLWKDVDKFKEVFGDLKISEGVKVDTTEVTDKLGKILSGKAMRNAQMGGSPLRNAFGYASAFIGMPSIEKSRAAAEALNQINANIREAMNSTLTDIKEQESTLAGMLESGDLKLDDKGNVLEGSTIEAKTLVVQLENTKLILDSILADVKTVDKAIDKSPNNISKVMKQLNFTSPVLLKNNAIVNNINAGYDKGGKALKFQSRLAEILNYSFQLMSRHVGQIFKRMMLMLNPVNLIQKAFRDFASYDVKWQRTMNVIKYNLRHILKPFMEWLAQQLVNILGIVNAIIKGIGRAFGKDWDLFDKSAASAEQMREELEQAANVTASFDELHDIGTSSSGNPAMDLMGDIYTPQWNDLYDTISNSATNLAKFLTPIFEGLGKAIKWCLDNWKLLVGAFLAFKIGQGLLKLWNFFGGLGDLMSGLPGIFLKAIAAIGGTALTALSQIGTVKLAKEWDQMSKDDRWKRAGINIGEGIAGGALIGFAIGGPTGAAVGALVGGLATSFEQLAIAAYNGNEAATVLTGTLGGAGLGGAIGFLVGGPIGAAIGAIGGGLVGALAGAAANAVRCKGEFNKLKISSDDLAWATAQVDEKSNNYQKSLYNLKQMEQQTGLSGEKLYKSVQDGVLAFKDMTYEQQEVYKAYKATKDALIELNKAQETQLKYSTRIMLDDAKKADSFTTYIQAVQDGVNNGIISNKEMVDQFAQSYAELDSTQRQIFLNQLPTTLRDSVKEQSTQYISGWEKAKTQIGEFFSNFGENMTKLFTEKFVLALPGIGKMVADSLWPAKDVLDELKATIEDLEASTKALNEAQEEQARIESELAELEKTTGLNAAELYEQVNNGTKSWYELTDAEKEVYNKYYDLQQAMKTTDEAMKKNIDNMASVDWQAAQTSGNYSKFIQDLMDANMRGEISTEDMQRRFSEAYAKLDTESRKTFMESIPENMRTGIEQGASDFMTGFEGFSTRFGRRLSEFAQNVGKVFSNIWDVGQSIGNWIAGKGFKTDAQIRDLLKDVPKMAVGTNYVQSDGLAYLHQGEAVVPKKYNAPYQPSDTSKLENAIEKLNQQVSQINQAVDRGINVKGQFVQRGTDLVASVERTNNKMSNTILSNKIYAR